jgi:outer membrane protein OmpA-like peptidoglycan-associated protein
VTGLSLRIVLCLVGFGLFGAYAVYGPAGARRIEAKVQAIAAEELAQSGFRWADVRADGRTVIVSGEAPDEDDLAEAVSVLRTTSGGAIAYVNAASATVYSASKQPPSLTVAEEGNAAPVSSPLKPAQLGANVEALNRDSTFERQAEAQAACQIAINKAFNGRRLTFQHNSSWLGERGRALLDDFNREISDCAAQTIIIEGHTDASGTAAINLNVSKRRAEAVKDYLDKLDTGASFEIRAYGETRPIASNQSEDGRRANRRIDFVVAPRPVESDQ